MKFVYFTLFFLISINLGLSQNDEANSQKYDSTFTIGNGQSLLYKKKKSALYDNNKKAFIIPFQKNHLHYCENGELLIQISKEGKINRYDWEKGFDDESEKNEIEHFLFNEVAEIYFQSQILPHGRLLINEYYKPMPIDIPLQNMYGEDSISNDGDFIYPPRPTIEYKSGVFDLNEKKWLIEPSNRSIQLINERLFVYQNNIDTDNKESWIDVYEMDKKNLLLLTSIPKNSDLSENLPILLKALDIDSLSHVPHSLDYYYSFKNGKKGILNFCLFNGDCNPHFQVLLETDFNVLHFHPSTNTVITSKESGKDFQFRRYNHESEKVEMISRFKKEMTIIENNFEGSEEIFIDEEAEFDRGFIRFKFDYLDPLVVIQDVIPEFKSDIPLYDQFGSDSIDASGFLVYAPPEPGLYASGVFDTKKNTWVIEPCHLEVVPIENQVFMTSKFKLDSNGRLLDEEVTLKVYDSLGNIIVNDAEYKNMKTLEFVQKVFQTDSISYSPFQQIPKELLTSKEYEGIDQFFNLRNKGEVQIYKVNKSMLNSLLYDIQALSDQPSELQLITSSENLDVFNQGIQTIFLKDKNGFSAYFQKDMIQGDSLYSININKAKGKLKVTYFSGESFFRSGLLLAAYKHSLSTENSTYGFISLHNDTIKRMIVTENEYSNILERPFSKMTYEYVYSDREVKVKHDPIEIQTSQFLGYFWDNIEIVKHIEFELENNVLWRKDNGTWNQTGKAYADLKSTSYGYIGRSAKYEESLGETFFELPDDKYSDSLSKHLVNQSSTFQLLNNKMKPYTFDSISSFNSIKEFEFGYQLFFEPTKSILVDLKGKILCRDHFDKYYKENGAIYGENEEIYKTDELWGDLIFDEDGNPIILQKAEKRKIVE